MKTIQLTQGKVALVDDADYEAVNAHKWFALKKRQGFYAVRNILKLNGKRGPQYLHHFLSPGISRVDHRDGDGLNNQRHNLRSATNKQNSRGFCNKKAGVTSKFRGVSRDRRRLKWVAKITVDGEGIFLGHFADEFDAARAYNEAALKYFGEFAHLNII